MENRIMRLNNYSSLWAISLLLVSNLLFAQVKEQTAEQQLKQRLGELKTFKASFSQTVVDLQGQVLQSADGLLQLSQPNKLYWELFEPNESLLIADGDSLWNIDPFVEQATVFDQQQAIDSNPMVLLAQSTSDAWDKFSITLTADEQNTDFRVEALSEDSQIAALIMSFVGNDLSKLTIIDRQQQTSTSLFSNIQQNIPIEASVFEADIPDGYDVDDQRN
jgi:outer membrane lipoprotein carrier protein